MARKTFTGINIQFPISQLILSGEKIVETRTYPIPSKYLNTELLLIETPGKSGDFKARAVALIKFTACIEYKSKKEFYADTNRHKVTPNSEWAWKDKKKFGWELVITKKLPNPLLLSKKKGIVFTTNLQVEV